MQPCKKCSALSDVETGLGLCPNCIRELEVSASRMSPATVSLTQELTGSFGMDMRDYVKEIQRLAEYFK